MTNITPDLVLKAYAYGVFPMAKSRGDTEVFWVQPKLRGIIPLDAFHLPRSLRRRMLQGTFTVTINTCFDAVMKGCAETTKTRPDTWINNSILRLFNDLHRAHLAHSVEVWKDGALVGGVYGLAMGGAFFGESMFGRVTDASKVALTHLIAILKHGGFSLMDTQFLTDHLKRFGAIEIPQADYLTLLSIALAGQGCFEGPLSQRDLKAALLSQRSTQTS